MAEPGVMEKLGLDEEEWGEILSLFIETTISDLDDLSRAIRKGDPALAVQPCHSIKGAAANLGFDVIASLAAEVEAQARRGVLRGAEKRAKRIKQNLDGLKLCAALRENADQGYVYIIFLTARNSKDDLVEALQAGADDYVTKPFDRSELLARIKTGMRVLALEKSLKDANEEIRMMSILDPLTGLYNRRYLNEHLEQEVKRALRYGHALHIALCDIDHFKIVNDTYGHQVGDEVLSAFADFLKSAIRHKVDWVARYGGEEFVLVFPETDAPGAKTVSERLCQAIAQNSFQARGKTIKITVSFGISGFQPGHPDRALTPDILLMEADRSLLKAKQEGRNRVETFTFPLFRHCDIPTGVKRLNSAGGRGFPENGKKIHRSKAKKSNKAIL